jgi:type II secretory pathway pseudopilin PulG
MSKTIIAIIIVVVIAGIGFWVYQSNSVRQNQDEIISVKNNAESQNDEFIENSDQDKELAENQAETNNTIMGDNQLVTDDFSMELPDGWKKVVSAAAEVSAMATNLNEIINDAAAQEINFKSYLAVSLDTISGQTMEKYMQSIKAELQKTNPGVVFANENDLIINEKSARAVEVEMTQRGIDFKILIVAVRGNGDDVWVLSYNTVKSSWDGYAEAFADSARSFVLKI